MDLTEASELVISKLEEGTIYSRVFHVSENYNHEAEPSQSSKLP
jgi:hypothetical protein